MKAPTANRGRIANLKPFKKGQSGNPSGRPKKQHDITELAREGSVEAIKKLVKLVQSDDDKIALAAANAVLDRAFGKPKETVDVNADHTHTHVEGAIPAVARFLERFASERGERDNQGSLPN